MFKLNYNLYKFIYTIIYSLNLISQTSTGKIKTKLRFFTCDFNNIMIIKQGKEN